jgi:hypothetical protein
MDRTWFSERHIDKSLLKFVYAEIMENTYETLDDIIDFITEKSIKFLSFENIKTRLKNKVNGRKNTFFEF